MWQNMYYIFKFCDYEQFLLIEWWIKKLNKCAYNNNNNVHILWNSFSKPLWFYSLKNYNKGSVKLQFFPHFFLRSMYCKGILYFCVTTRAISLQNPSFLLWYQQYSSCYNSNGDNCTISCKLLFKVRILLLSYT